MKWSDWIPPILARKASTATRSLVMLVTPGQPVWTPRNFEQLSKEGYEANVTVYACVNEYAKAIAGLSWLLYQGHKELEEHPLLTLLARPNPMQGGGRFFEMFTGYLMLSGNAYMERVGPSSGPPKELYALRPDRMTVVPHTVELIAGYEYRAGGSPVRLPATFVMHEKLFAPTDDWYGLSPIVAASRVVDTDNEAVKWNFSLLKNLARPSGALVAQGTLNDPQFKRLKTELTEEHIGSSTAGLPLLLEGGLDWKAMGLSPVDMDWIESRKMSKQDIAMAYGMPGEIIGLREATYENRREARRAFYLQRAIPLADVLRDDLNNWLTPLFGDRLKLDYDRDAIEALQEDREKVWARIQKSDWLTVNEKREATGYDAHPEGDVLLVPFSLTPIGAAGDTGASFGDMAATDQSEETRGLSFKADDVVRARLWKSKVREFLPIEVRYRRAVAEYFRRQRDGVLTRLQQYPAILTRAAAVWPETKGLEELLFELDQETEQLRLVSRPYFDEAVRKGGASIWLEAGASGEFGAEAVNSRMRIDRQLRNVRRIAESARARVARAIEQGLNAEGGAETLPEIASRIRQAYAVLSGPQAAIIARTETARAFSEGREEAMDQMGLEEAEWLSARDEHVRQVPFNHTIDGEIRRRGQAFSNGLLYPHDPAGAPGNVINCRCVALPVIRRKGAS